MEIQTSCRTTPYLVERPYVTCRRYSENTMMLPSCSRGYKERGGKGGTEREEVGRGIQRQR